MELAIASFHAESRNRKLVSVAAESAEKHFDKRQHYRENQSGKESVGIKTVH